MCDNTNCGYDDCNCEQPINVIQQAVNDALAGRIDELDGYADRAETGATNAEASAVDAAASATQAGDYRDQSQTILNSAQALVPAINETSANLQETAEIVLELINNASSYQIVKHAYTIIGGESTITIPADYAALTVQSITVEGGMLQSQTGDFVFDSTTRVITLAQAFDTEAAGVVITIQLGQSNAESPETVLSALKSPSGAGLVNTAAGSTVEARLASVDTSIQILTASDAAKVPTATLASNTGAAMVGTSNGLTVQAMLNRLDVFVKPETYGMVGNDQASAHANSLALYNTLEALRTAGGGLLFLTPNTTYWVDFINFIPSNVVILGNNATIKHVDPTSAYGRGGLVIGSSREWNYAKAKAAYVAGTYPVSVLDSTVTDLGQGVYLRDNQSAVQAENVIIHDLRMETYFSTATLWGGYAINVVNAQNVRVHNLRTSGWTQAFNIGNDSATSSPSSHDVMFYNVVVEKPDLVRTYYSIGFIANSTCSGVDGGIQLVAMTDGTTNGSGVATNYCEYPIVKDIFIPNLGLTVTSEGVLLNNTKGAIVDNIEVHNCRRVVATYYTSDSYNDVAVPNMIRNVSGQGLYIISLSAKYAHVDTFEGKGTYTYDLYFANNNAANNVVNKTPRAMGFGGTNTQAWFMQNNTIDGWVQKYIYLRPADLVLNDKSTLQGWNANITLATSTTDVTLLWRVPETFQAINDIRAFISWGPNAAANGSTMQLALTQMVAFDGNITTAPNVLFSNSKTADGTVTDTTLVTSISTDLGMVKLADTSNTIGGVTTTGLAYSHYVCVTMTLNSVNNYFKHMRIAGYMRR